MFRRTLLVIALSLPAAFGIAWAGPPHTNHVYGPAPDFELMAFKDQGVWYFPCAAPAFPLRIGFHALSYGPPPYRCLPVGCAPVSGRRGREGKIPR